MNGWKRLYIFIVVSISIPAFGLWYSSKPPSPYISYLSDCYETSYAIKTIPAVRQHKNPFNESISISANDAAEYLEFLSNGIDKWSDKENIFFSEKDKYTLEEINSFSSEENNHPAKEYITQVSISNFEQCRDELLKLKSGQLEKSAISEWMDDLKDGIIFLAIFFIVLYSIGWGLGWVWLGFRKHKK